MKNILIFAASLVAGAYYFRNFYLYLAALITGGFLNIPYCLSVIVSGLAVTVLILSFLTDRFILEIKGLRRIILSAVCILLGAATLVFYIMSAGVHANNLSYGVDRDLVAVWTPIGGAIVLAAGVLSVVTRKKTRPERTRPLGGMSLVRRIAGTPVACLAFYSLACLFRVPFLLRNIERSPLGFIAVLFYLLLSVYNFGFLLTDAAKRTKTRAKVAFFANLGVLCFFIFAEIVDFSFLALVGKPFCPLTFAASVAIFPIVYIAFNAGTLIYTAAFLIQSTDALHSL